MVVASLVSGYVREDSGARALPSSLACRGGWNLPARVRVLYRFRPALRHSAAKCPMRPLRALLLLSLVLLSSACMGYRLMRPEEIEIPDYTPRAVAMPAQCEGLIARVAERGMTGLGASDSQMVLFCQQQQLIRAQEEEAADRKIEAHARAADFALHLATVAIGTTIAVLAWLF